MLDIFFIVVAIIFFAVSVWFTRGCDNLSKEK